MDGDGGFGIGKADEFQEIAEIFEGDIVSQEGEGKDEERDECCEGAVFCHAEPRGDGFVIGIGIGRSSRRGARPLGLRGGILHRNGRIRHI